MIVKQKKAKHNKVKREVVKKSSTVVTNVDTFYVNSKVLLIEEQKFVSKDKTNLPKEKRDSGPKQSWEQMINETGPARKRLLRDFEERGLRSYKKGYKEALQDWHPQYEPLGSRGEPKSSDIIPKSPRSPSHRHPKNAWKVSKK